ncbi:hypothetical protein BHE74_00022834 [Ensete ventricosum]|nr:hypothetical protein BHE74_00022834 [Ensete ventricosum]
MILALRLCFNNINGFEPPVIGRYHRLGLLPSQFRSLSPTTRRYQSKEKEEEGDEKEEPGDPMSISYYDPDLSPLVGRRRSLGDVAKASQLCREKKRGDVTLAMSPFFYF